MPACRLRLRELVLTLASRNCHLPRAPPSFGCIAARTTLLLQERRTASLQRRFSSAACRRRRRCPGDGDGGRGDIGGDSGSRSGRRRRTPELHRESPSEAAIGAPRPSRVPARIRFASHGFLCSASSCSSASWVSSYPKVPPPLRSALRHLKRRQRKEPTDPTHQKTNFLSHEGCPPRPPWTLPFGEDARPQFPCLA